MAHRTSWFGFIGMSLAVSAHLGCASEQVAETCADLQSHCLDIGKCLVSTNAGHSSVGVSVGDTESANGSDAASCNIQCIACDDPAVTAQQDPSSNAGSAGAAGTVGSGGSAMNGEGGAAGTSAPTCGHVPSNFDLRSYNGCQQSAKLSVAARVGGAEVSFFEAGLLPQTAGQGVGLSLTSTDTDCGPVDLVLASMSGALDFQASEPVHVYVFEVAMITILWMDLYGTTPNEATYYSEAWRRLMLDMFDCSELARPERVCKLSHDVPPGTLQDQGIRTRFTSNECQREFLLIASE